MKTLFILQLFGIRFEISKVGQNEKVVPMEKPPQVKKQTKKPAAKKANDSDCDVCLGETEIRLAGSTQKMDCPNCKGKKRAAQLLS